jgi:uncharacterized glyoxalase superfamily protein PhnB
MAIEIRGLCPLLQVFDMPTSIKFYCEGLGFEVAMTDGKPVPDNDWVLLRLNGSDLMLNTVYKRERRPPAPDLARMAAHEDTSVYFGCPDVDAAWAHLQAKGIASRAPRIAPYGMKQLYLKDPDGYSLCFQWQA